MPRWDLVRSRNPKGAISTILNASQSTGGPISWGTVERSRLPPFRRWNSLWNLNMKAGAMVRSWFDTDAPPWVCVTIKYETYRPSPVPWPGGLVVKNGSKNRRAVSGGIPGPFSSTSITMLSPSALVRTVMTGSTPDTSNRACADIQFSADEMRTDILNLRATDSHFARRLTKRHNRWITCGDRWGTKRWLDAKGHKKRDCTFMQSLIFTGARKEN